MTDRTHYVDTRRLGTVRPAAAPTKDAIPPTLSWGIVVTLAVVIAGMALTPIVPARDKFVPAVAAAVGLFILWALIKKASAIRG